MGTVEILEGPSVEPVTESEVITHAVIDHDTVGGTWIPSRIKAAREFVEARARVALINRKLRLHLDGFPCDYIKVPFPPVSDVEISFLNSEQEFEALDPSRFHVSTARKPARVYPINSGFPSPFSRPDNVRVDYTAGYGATPEDVPHLYKQAILMLVAYWYAHREAYTLEMTEMHRNPPLAFDRLLESAGVVIEMV